MAGRTTDKLGYPVEWCGFWRCSGVFGGPSKVGARRVHGFCCVLDMEGKLKYGCRAKPV
jgi:hypothetical protein